MNVERSINQYLNGKGKSNGRQPDERFTSFDYCYNHFYSFYRDNRVPELADKSNIQLSCLQLGFYLASWGMLRGSSFLIEKSIKHYENVISVISKMEPTLWEIDVDCYNEENIELIMKAKCKLIDALGRKNAKTWDTLVSKIMLGVFGSVPAFDAYFTQGMKVSYFNEKSLLKIRNFYVENKNSIDSYKIHTYEFLTSEEKLKYYTLKLNWSICVDL